MLNYNWHLCPSVVHLKDHVCQVKLIFVNIELQLTYICPSDVRLKDHLPIKIQLTPTSLAAACSSLSTLWFGLNTTAQFLFVVKTKYTPACRIQQGHCGLLRSCAFDFRPFVTFLAQPWGLVMSKCHSRPLYVSCNGCYEVVPKVCVCVYNGGRYRQFIIQMANRVPFLPVCLCVSDCLHFSLCLSFSSAAASLSVSLHMQFVIKMLNR